MTKFFQYLISFIVFILLASGVLYCFHNANYIVVTYSDIGSSEYQQKNVNPFDGLNTLFSGLAFIVIIYTLFVQMLQLKDNMKQQEKNSILHSIGTLQTNLSNLNALYNNTQKSQSGETTFTHFSDYLYHKICETFQISEVKYQTSTSLSEKNIIIRNFIRAYEEQVQNFIEISYLFITIHERIENSNLLNSSEKDAFREQAIFLFHHSDIKVLTLMFIELNSNGNDALPKNLRAHFTEQEAKKAIKALGNIENTEFVDKIYTSIRNLRIKNARD